MLWSEERAGQLNWGFCFPGIGLSRRVRVALVVDFDAMSCKDCLRLIFTN